MNFFEAQERAKRKTNQLVILFICGLIGVVAAVNMLAYCVDVFWYSHHNSGYLLSYKSHIYLSLSTVFIILMGTWSRMSTLQENGGEGLALELGATLIKSTTQDENEKRLCNIVEEMAIASGMPLPMVFVMNDSDGINGFAAGNSPTHSVIAVTRGALDQLNRDELQALVAHEIGHIKNYDVLINMRIIGILAGLFLINLFGRLILEGTSNRGSRGTFRSFSSSESKRGTVPIEIIGLGLYVIGGLGFFWGKVIQAAISRSREYLADASAVQFTRQTLGLAGLFKKIQNENLNYDINSARQTEIAHMLFLSESKMFLSSLFATHPPLEDRLLQLGKLTQLQNQSIQDVSHKNTKTSTYQSLKRDQLMGFVMQDQNKISSIPDQVIITHNFSATEPIGELESSIGLMISYFVAENENIAFNQMTAIRECSEEIKIQILNHIKFNFFKKYSSEKRFELLLRLVPEVRTIKADQRKPLMKCILKLISADNKITLLEAGYATSFIKVLSENGPPMTNILTNATKEKDLRLLAETYINDISKLGASKSSWEKVMRSFLKLIRLSAIEKQNFIQNLISIFKFDDIISEEEFETLRCFCFLMDIPVPLLK